MRMMQWTFYKKEKTYHLNNIACLYTSVSLLWRRTDTKIGGSWVVSKHYATFNMEALVVPREHMVEQSIEVSRVRESATLTSKVTTLA